MNANDKILALLKEILAKQSSKSDGPEYTEEDKAKLEDISKLLSDSIITFDLKAEKEELALRGQGWEEFPFGNTACIEQNSFERLQNASAVIIKNAYNNIYPIEKPYPKIDSDAISDRVAVLIDALFDSDDDAWKDNIDIMGVFGYCYKCYDREDLNAAFNTDGGNYLLAFWKANWEDEDGIVWERFFVSKFEY